MLASINSLIMQASNHFEWLLGLIICIKIQLTTYLDADGLVFNKKSNAFSKKTHVNVACN